MSQTGYVVLGLVSRQPTAGHELARFAEISIKNFFPLTRSHIYTELEKLEGLGLLSSTEVPQDRLPTKRVYEITAEGESVLGKWLAEAPVEEEKDRCPMLVRVFFGERLSTERLTTLLDEYEESARARRDWYAGFVDQLVDEPEYGFPRLTAIFGVKREQAKLDFVAEARTLLPGLIEGAKNA
ncbi:MAG: PadR family transcriptional regulator [Acidimicrobiales bacterium]